MLGRVLVQLNMPESGTGRDGLIDGLRTILLGAVRLRPPAPGAVLGEWQGPRLFRRNWELRKPMLTGEACMSNGSAEAQLRSSRDRGSVGETAQQNCE